MRCLVKLIINVAAAIGYAIFAVVLWWLMGGFNG
jgi:hypothetical protein